MPVELLLYHFFQSVQKPGVGPCVRAAEVGRSDRHGGSWGREGWGSGAGGSTEPRAFCTYAIVGYVPVG
ncbi:hypothetical protein STRAU_6378 [Streptomyces aurantiacus JA 4570]|uniref:Uncharacterized protein n=1 Tax=Streptomyces aurantiacus JA 4570 TaxID=1286094 RepID=S3ZQA5_9ACTN|nr:hypothetical protein STRAU_6378 [Streptomyces aurantiacus JA 4570]